MSRENDQGAGKPGRNIPGQRSALILLMLAYACSLADRMIVGIVAPQLKVAFSLSDAQLGMLGGLAFAVFYATLGLPIAVLADRYRRKTIILISLFVFSLMTALCGFAGGFASLLALRMMVGVGEAGVNPASQSVIADYFSQERRPFAMSILAMGANVGMIAGFLIGGITSQLYGWRVAFFVMGLPGMLLVVAAIFLLREPSRGQSDGVIAGAVKASASYFSSVKYLLKTPSLMHLFMGCMITGMLGYGNAQWLPTFFVRSYGLEMSTVGLILAGMFGILGAAGTLLGGYIVQRADARRAGLGLKIVGLSQVVMIPVTLVAYLAPELWQSLCAFAPVIVISGLYLGPTFSEIQTRSPIAMRAKMAALLMLTVNLIGYGLGPLAVGVISDLLTVSSGNNGLRQAMAIMSFFSIWSGYHYWRSSAPSRRPDSEDPQTEMSHARA